MTVIYCIMVLFYTVKQNDNHNHIKRIICHIGKYACLLSCQGLDADIDSSLMSLVNIMLLSNQIKSNQSYSCSPKSQSHRLSGLYNLYSEQHPLSLDP